MNAMIRFFSVLAFPAIVGGIIFISAGRIDLPFVWAVAGTMGIFYGLMLGLIDPDLIQERMAPAGHNQDRLTRPVGGVLLFSHWILAGLDIGRFHWSPVPWGIQVAGLIGYVAALAVNLWALRVNRFYSSVVRIQADRGHCVVDSGPYRFVRHPGYTATLFAMLSGGVALGSWLAVLPILGFAATFIHRTILEDRMLQSDLQGYASYSERVRYRLVPGIF